MKQTMQLFVANNLHLIDVEKTAQIRAAFQFLYSHIGLKLLHCKSRFLMQNFTFDRISFSDIPAG